MHCIWLRGIDLLVKVANIGKQSPQRTKPLENEIGISSSGKWSDFCCSIQNQLVICLSKGTLCTLIKIWTISVKNRLEFCSLIFSRSLRFEKKVYTYINKIFGMANWCFDQFYHPINKVLQIAQFLADSLLSFSHDSNPSERYKYKHKFQLELSFE